MAAVHPGGPRRLRGVHGRADGRREREHRVPPVRRRRRDALDARALQEPGAPGRRDRGHRDRDGHLLEPRRGGRARGQRGQARARAQGRRRLRLRARGRRGRRLDDGQREPQPRALHGRDGDEATPRATSGSTLIHPDDREDVARQAEAYANGTQFEASYRLVGYDGVERWVLDRNVPYDGRRRPQASGSAWCSTSAIAASSSAGCSRASTSCAAPTPSCASCACRPSSRRAPTS